MEQSTLEAAYESLKEIKFKLAALECEFKTDSDDELNNDSAEFIRCAIEDIEQTMLLIYNSF